MAKIIIFLSFVGVWTATAKPAKSKAAQFLNSETAPAPAGEKSKAAQFLTLDTPAQTFDAVIFQRKNFNDLAVSRQRLRPRYQPK